jgi:acyl dehydratase
MTSEADRLPAWRRRITDADAHAWSVLLADDNPLHSDPATTGASGLGVGLVNPGPANIGYLMTLLLESCPGAAIEAFEARFVAPVLTPVDVTASGYIEQRDRQSGGDVLAVVLELRAGDVLCVSARARVRVSHRADRES